METFSRFDMKTEAKDSLRLQTQTLILITLVYMVLTGIGTGVSSIFDMDTNRDTVRLIAGFSTIIGFLVSFALAFVQLGYAKVSLKAYDKETVAINDLFAYVNQFVRAFGLVLVMTVKTMLWSLLFLIPGIIAAISYSQSLYIAAENPELSITEVIDESKKLMRGRKWEYFVLGLSFILWSFLVAVTFGIAVLWVAPYMQITYAAFYRRLCLSVYGTELHSAEAMVS